jgi:DNA-binding response OmpR family regulator
MTKRILIVDDDQELCEEIAEILIEEGYKVTSVFDGLEGKRFIEKYDYDILILDVKIPGLSGLDILQGIREQNIALKVLILTGGPLSKGSREQQGYNDKEASILKMADGIVNKPFDVRLLLSKIKEL